MRNLLLDTGAFVALLDRSEKNHEHCVEFFSTFLGQIFTTEPVLTETLYLLGSSPRAAKMCIDFVVSGGTTLVHQSSTSLTRAATLMEKYEDIPMDFADATLVALAEDAGIDEIFTLDRRGFQSFRIHGKKAFKLWPQ